MNLSRRQEMFRYVFNSPVDCIFRIIEINGLKCLSKAANVKLIDLSKNGCKIETNLNLKSFGNKVKIHLMIKLNEIEIYVIGNVQWQHSIVNSNSYGIQIKNIIEVESTIIQELKIYAKQQKNPQNAS